MLGSVDRCALLKDPDHVGGHHRIGSTEPGQLLLDHRSINTQPDEGGDQDELHVGQLKGLEGVPLSGPPTVRHLSEQ
jgi:hypothetical protein